MGTDAVSLESTALHPVRIHAIPALTERNRLTTAFRAILAIPHLLVIWALGIAWGLTTLIAWFAILFTGRYPRGPYEFSLGALRWTTRVEAYLLLLTDQYPPFTLD